MAMGFGTFIAKVAAVKNKKEAMSADLNKMNVFMSTPLPEVNILNLIKLIFSYWLNQRLLFL